MSNSRSLYNDQASSSSSQNRIILKSILDSLRSADIKVLKTITLSESTIENSSIGLNVPASGRFTSLVVGFSNLNSPVTFNGPNNSSVNWNDGSLKLANTTLQLQNTKISSDQNLLITTPNLSLDSTQISLNSSVLKWGNGATISMPPASAGISQVRNTIVISDPILTVGDTTSMVTDSGIKLAYNSTTNYFLGQSKSKRLSNSTLNPTGRSLQFLTNPIVTSTDNVDNLGPLDKKVSNDTLINPINSNQLSCTELQSLSAERYFYSYEKIMLNVPIESTETNIFQTIDVTKYITKLYCLPPSLASPSWYRIELPDGLPDDGTIKCIQFLPPSWSDLMINMATEYSPKLLIHGKFCVPTYQASSVSNTDLSNGNIGDIATVYDSLVNVQQSMITMNSVGSSVLLNYDTTIQCWCLVSSGGY